MTLTPEQREEIEKRHERDAARINTAAKTTIADPFFQRHNDRAALLADNKELREQLTALTPTSPSPDRLTPELVERLFITSYDAKSFKTAIIDRLTTPQAPSGHRATAVSETVRDLIRVRGSLSKPGEEIYKIISHAVVLLTEPESPVQAPSVPTREELRAAIKKARSSWFYSSNLDRAVKDEMELDAILALFTPSPSPDQRGET